MIKRICTALVAVMIGAGAFTVPAFAYTGEDAGSAVPAVTAADVTADTGSDTEKPEEDKGTGIRITISKDGEESTNQVGTVQTNGSRLNVRCGGGMDYQVIDQLRPGDTVKVLGVEGDWVKVTVPELTGYVHKNYLNIHTETASGSENFELTEDNLQAFLQMFGQGLGSTPLTPDGNLTLVDDFGSITGTGKQFVTLVTKTGNYFYLIIDRDEKGNENVHFLNQVDEADLFALMDEDEAAAMKEQIAAEEAAKAAAEAAEKAKTEQTEPQPTEPAEQEQEQKPSKLPYAIGLILLIGACGAGGAFFYLKNKKSQAESAERPDPDADYREDDDGYDIPEESEEDEAEDSDDEEE